MSKKNKNPYHALYYIKTGKTEILLDNKKYTEIYKKGGTQFKSFKTEDEAKQWLDKVRTERQTKMLNLNKNRTKSLNKHPEIITYNSDKEDNFLRLVYCCKNSTYKNNCIKISFSTGGIDVMFFATNIIYQYVGDDKPNQVNSNHLLILSTQFDKIYVYGLSNIRLRTTLLSQNYQVSAIVNIDNIDVVLSMQVKKEIFESYSQDKAKDYIMVADCI